MQSSSRWAFVTGCLSMCDRSSDVIVTLLLHVVGGEGGLTRGVRKSMLDVGHCSSLWLCIGR